MLLGLHELVADQLIVRTNRDRPAAVPGLAIMRMMAGVDPAQEDGRSTDTLAHPDMAVPADDLILAGAGLDEIPAEPGMEPGW